MIYTWDASFEATPAQSLSRSLIDDEIRRFKCAIRERMAVEHRWGEGTTDTGRHIGGGTTVCLRGADPTAVTNPQEGALYLKTVGATVQLWIYVDGAWEQASTVDHATLTGRTDHDHTGLLLNNGGSTSANLNMNGHKIVTPGTEATYGRWTLKRHGSGAGYGHTSWGNIACKPADAVTVDKLSIGQVSITAVCSSGQYYETFHAGVGDLCFFPQIMCTAGVRVRLYLSDGGWGIYSGGGTSTTRIRYEYLYWT